MRRLSIFGVCTVVALAVVSSARAEWRSLGPTTPPITGTPQDVEILDAGYFTLATATSVNNNTQDRGYEIVNNDGGTAIPRTIKSTSSGSGLILSFIDSSNANCLTGITVNGFLTCPDAGPVTLISGSSGSAGFSLLRVQRTPFGSSFAVDNNSGFYYAPTPSNWQTISPAVGYFGQPAVSAFRLGATDYGLFGLGPGKAFVAADAGQLTGTFNTGIQPIHETQLFAVGPALMGLIAGDGGVAFASIGFDGGYALGPTLSLGGYEVTGLSFEYGTGGPEGNGFGMAVAQDGGSTTIFSAVPDPNAPAQTWVPNTNAPYMPPATSPPGTVMKVRCWHGQFCVLLTNAPGSDSVFLYYNSAAPTVARPTDLIVNEGACGIASVDAGDNDGDAIFLTWDAGTGSPLVLSYPPDGGRAAITVSTDAGLPQLCGMISPVPLPLSVTASDGVHVTASALTVFVTHTVPPGPPFVSSPPPAHAGGPGVTAFVDAGSGCPPQGYEWSQVVDAGFTVTLGPDGGSATFTPPAFYCSPDAGVARYQVRTIDGLLRSDAGMVDVLIEPWGPPGPALDGGTFVQQAGTRATYFATGAHPCAGSDAGFPGVDTTWFFSTSVPGVGFLSGGRPVNPGVVIPSIDVSTLDCTSGQVLLNAVAVTHGDTTGLTSPDAGITVMVVPVLQPVAAAGLGLDGGYDADAGEVTVTVSTTANCGSERNLVALLSVQQADGGSAGIPPPPPLAIPDFGQATEQFAASGRPCSGGALQVIGQLKDGDGGLGATARWQFLTPSIPAGVGSIEVGVPPTVTCEGGVARARGMLLAAPGAGQCPTATLSWAQLAGPPTSLLPQGNGAVQVEAIGPGFAELVGQSLSFRVTADAGGGNVASRDTSVPISATGLVGIQHLTDAPEVSASGILGVAVRLTNLTGCGISGAEYRESLDGLRYVPGSVRLDGQPVEATLQGDRLIVPRLDLPAQATRELVFSARPRLLSGARPNGQAFLNGVPISEAGQGLRAPRPAGCGCSGSGADVSALALALVGVLLRRGARRRA